MTRTRLVAFALLTAIAGAAACAAHPDQTVQDNLQPDRDDFTTNVSPFMETRCGSLDCHGQDGRGMRIYSQQGLRYAPADGGGRDNSQTTLFEQQQNYLAVVGLQPEEMSRAVASKGAYQSILLLQKPLDISGGGVRHKGGPVLNAAQVDPGWVCLTTWIAGGADANACSVAAKPL